ncbi:aspartate/glutamate racemase family protein [Sulfitobacter albidus]|uniref:Aspartate/glutamate racemase family protein n=2 Tax=Sulfitobacter albidus TaxID=2829501 RepID=A0A975JGA9_9RHOB|nr:aspartate/glutamate racemase family protein [Sulfitobacter albidus]
MRALLPEGQPLFVTRIPSGAEVTPESLRAMRGQIASAAGLLPSARGFACVGYGCTSATAQIGAEAVADLVQAGVATARVSDPLTACRAACAALGITRLALLSPYVASVSERLRAALGAGGIATPVFGSFNEPVEANVARIDPASTVAAATELARQGGVEAIFLSCTNLRTLAAIPEIEAATGLPCLSSNQVLAWHMGARGKLPGRLAQVRSQA